MKRLDPRSVEIIAALIVEFVTVVDAATGERVPLVTRDEAKGMTAEQIVSLIQVDHDPVPVAIAVALGWTPRQYNHPTNLSIKAIQTHRIKTAKQDVPMIAKSDRISAEQAEFQRRMLAKVGIETEAPAKQKFKRKWASRSFAQQRGVRR